MTQKERVLAKCGELAKSVSSGVWQDDKVTVFKKRSYRVESHDDTVRLSFDESIPETDPVWPLAAKILGIAEEERPSNDLLWEAWKEAAHAADWSQRVRKRETERFSEWLAGLEVRYE